MLPLVDGDSRFDTGAGATLIVVISVESVVEVAAVEVLLERGTPGAKVIVVMSIEFVLDVEVELLRGGEARANFLVAARWVRFLPSAMET